MVQLDKTQEIIAFKPYKSRQLVLAGPGRGKTELVSQRILFLVDESRLDPSELLILSFSRSAVRTLSNRLRSLGPLSPGVIESLRHISIRTFDSWTFRMLRFFEYSIRECLSQGYDANIELLSKILSEQGHAALTEDHISGLRRIKHIIVDEVQDLSGVRASLVLQLLDLICSDSDDSRGFTLLGDENQAIYDFAYRENNKGITAIEFLTQIRTKWKTTLVEQELKRNYRCLPPVDAVISKSAEILKKSRAQGRDPIPELQSLMNELHSGEIGQALDNEDCSTAILCRNNGQVLLQSFHIRDGLQADTARRLKVNSGGIQARLPFWVGAFLGMYSAKAPLDKSTVEQIYAALSQQGVKLPYDANKLWFKITEIMRSSSDKSIPREKLIEKLRWPDSLPDDEYEDENGMVLLTTVHQSKGQEFDHVMVLRDGLAEDNHDNSDVAEEGRIVYVAISRAKNNVSCIHDDSGVRLRRKRFNKGKHERWHGVNVVGSERDRRYINYLEIGVQGDMDEHSFVCESFHGCGENVKKLQFYLANQASSLVGEEVNLRKRTVVENDTRVVYYDIVLIRPDCEILLGTCSDQLTLDLLKLRNHKNLKMPREIEGLRISQVYSYICSDRNRDNVADPFDKSGIWLCVLVYGIGKYEYYFN